MRGNEKNARAQVTKNTLQFPIPMRGNETLPGLASGYPVVQVSDPHEG